MSEQFIGQRKPPSITNLVVTAAVALGVLIYLILALNTEDPLWFWPFFEEEPSLVAVYCYGELSTFAPGDDGYDGLTALFQDSLSGQKRWDPITMSLQTYEEYTTSDRVVVVEAAFAESVRVHSVFKYFSQVDRLVVPLDGRHASIYPVFAQNNGLVVPGSFQLDTTQPFVDLLADTGICELQP